MFDWMRESGTLENDFCRRNSLAKMLNIYRKMNIAYFYVRTSWPRFPHIYFCIFFLFSIYFNSLCLLCAWGLWVDVSVCVCVKCNGDGVCVQFYWLSFSGEFCSSDDAVVSVADVLGARTVSELPSFDLQVDVG